MWSSKSLIIILFVTLGSSWFSERGSKVAEANPYGRQSERTETDEYEDYTVKPNNIDQTFVINQQVGPMNSHPYPYPYNQYPYNQYPYNPNPYYQKPNPYEGLPVLTFLDRIHKQKMCALSLYTRCEAY